MSKKNRDKRVTAARETLAELPDTLRSSAEECLEAAEKSKYRAIRAELVQLAETYIERARIRETSAAHTPR